MGYIIKLPTKTIDSPTKMPRHRNLWFLCAKSSTLNILAYMDKHTKKHYFLDIPQGIKTNAEVEELFAKGKLEQYAPREVSKLTEDGLYFIEDMAGRYFNVRYDSSVLTTTTEAARPLREETMVPQNLTPVVLGFETYLLQYNDKAVWLLGTDEKVQSHREAVELMRLKPYKFEAFHVAGDIKAVPNRYRLTGDLDTSKRHNQLTKSNLWWIDLKTKSFYYRVTANGSITIPREKAMLSLREESIEIREGTSDEIIAVVHGVKGTLAPEYERTADLLIHASPNGVYTHVPLVYEQLFGNGYLKRGK